MGASKSAKKREVIALQALGEKLTELTEKQLREMELPEFLFDAVIDASRMKSRGALRRQCQLIGKLMRSVDVEPIRRALDSFQRQEEAEKDVFRQSEYWRDRIVKSKQDGLKEFFEMTGNTNRDVSSTLIEYLENSHEASKRALRRKLFRQVHDELTKATIGR